MVQFDSIVSLTGGRFAPVSRGRCEIFSNVPCGRDPLQEGEQEPPLRPPLPQELQGSFLGRGRGPGRTESPYEVWNVDIINNGHCQVTDVLQCFLFFCFRKSTATLLIPNREKETV